MFSSEDKRRKSQSSEHNEGKGSAELRRRKSSWDRTLSSGSGQNSG